MDKSLETEAKHAAEKAVLHDNDKRYKQAICYYNVAAALLSKLPSDSPLFHKAEEYRERIAKLQRIVDEEDEKKGHQGQETELSRCKYLLNEALNEDSAGWKHTAVTLYIEAAQLGLDTRKHLKDAATREKLKDITALAIARAEALEGKDKKDVFDNSLELLKNLPPVPESIFPSSSSVENASPTSPDSFNSQASPTRPPLHRGSSAHLRVMGPVGNYTEEEKRVLYHTSHINDNEFVPFMRGDLAERFQLSSLFTDRDGLLELAPKQQIDFARWARPSEIFPPDRGSGPVMVMGNHVDYYSIKQTVISDCSFVASLAVSAQYEKRFGRTLITSIIYPQTKNNKPVYNPYGKYMVKLHINGVKRKVIIDDRFPVGRENQLLCSYSSNRGELWISLLEKAYMKVMGGYDFPGSNSNIDLHALTGWIPERWAIRPTEPDFNKDGLFRNLLKRWPNGDVLVTVATGELSDPIAEKTGLVPTHAYAVLDIKQLNGTRLLQLKNPWSHLRWRGNYSEHDAHHWTSELRRTLNYDPDSASQFDNGIFWIDYDSICAFFDVFYLNWNPGLFNYTYCIHQMWQAGVGPIKDRYNIGCNPQFSLEVQPGVSGAVWILLTRHITEIADFRQNQEYITVLVYKNDGKRVYYPHDPPPYIDGVRINSPHYLSKIKLDSQSESRYTLVISQYENMNTIYYTLRAYGTCPFVLRKIEDPYKYEKEATDGRWIGETAGGCSNHQATYRFNPRYQLVLEGPTNNNHLLIILKGPKQYQIGFEIISDSESTAAFGSKSSGPFRSGFVYLELQNVPGGKYNIIPSTYLPGQEGPFFLTCKASCDLHLTRPQ